MRNIGIFCSSACLIFALLLSVPVSSQTTGGIIAWGWNNYGQLDVVPPNFGFLDVDGGVYHTMALRSDGSVVVWGENSYLQQSIPSPNSGFTAIASGSVHCLGLRSDSTVTAWGFSSYGQCDVPLPNNDFIAIAGGRYHSLGLKSDSTIVAWGLNDDGQCDVPEPNGAFIAIAAGWYHSLALKADGSIVAWGRNDLGQCDVPLPNTDYISVDGGWYHTLGLKSDSTVVAFGRNYAGECNVPSPNEDFIMVAGGGNHSLGLKSNGTIVAWGNNVHEQCDVPSPNGIFWMVAGGGYHGLGLTDAPICEVEPDTVLFGDVPVDGFGEAGFVIRSVGFGPLAGTVSESCDRFTVVSGSGVYSIDPGDSLAVTVRFEPLSEGPDTCSIETGIECSAVVCIGSGLGPVCNVSPDTLDFGSVTLGTSRDLTFALTNIGGGSLTGSVSASCGPFSIVSGEGAYGLGNGDTLFVTVRFEPLATDSSFCNISAGTACDSVACRGIGDRAPHIYSVRDVPGDQGGFLNVAWYAVPGDDSVERLISRYTVWRAIDAEALALEGLDPDLVVSAITDIPLEPEMGIMRKSAAGESVYFWKLISSVDAYYLEAYSEIVPTVFDSTGVCEEYHYLQIISHTSDPGIFWISPPDSGRSVDNLAPGAPQYLAAEQSYDPEGLSLSWVPNLEADLGGYAIYRGVSEDFVPGSGNMVASTGDTAYFDSQWSWEAGYFYKLSAVDINGNESGYTLISPSEVTGGDTPVLPQVFALYQNAPNPFNPSTVIRFDLPKPVHIVLSVYDVRGRLVSTLVDRQMNAGSKEIAWAATDKRGSTVSSGIYFYRLVAGEFVQTKKMVLLR